MNGIQDGAGRPPSRPRTPGEAAIWLITLAGAVAISSRWWDVSNLRIPVLQAVFPILGALAVGWAVVMVARRRRSAVTVCAVLVAIVPLGLGALSLRSSAVAEKSGDQVVMTANLYYGEADPAALVSLVRQRAVDLLVLTEVTPQAAVGLEAAGLEQLLPNAVGSAREGASGTVIRSRHRLSPLDITQVPRRFDSPVARVHAPRGSYVVKGVHTYPPSGSTAAGWHRQLNGLAAWTQAQPAGEPVVLAGDFNASQAHPAFRRIAALAPDAHRATGAGWVRTWPLAGRVPAFVHLDHVLVRGGDVAAAGVERLEGTDHAVVWARWRMVPTSAYGPEMKSTASSLRSEATGFSGLNARRSSLPV